MKLMYTEISCAQMPIVHEIAVACCTKVVCTNQNMAKVVLEGSVIVSAHREHTMYEHPATTTRMYIIAGHAHIQNTTTK